MTDVRAWLRSQGPERVVELFEANEIDAAVLRGLNNDAWSKHAPQLGARKKRLPSRSALRRLMHAAANLKTLELASADGHPAVVAVRAGEPAWRSIRP